MGLWERFRDCSDPKKKARLLNELVKQNEPLVKLMVGRFLRATRSSLEKEDAHQAGLIGLMTAIRRYDPSKGKLSTYAGFWISKELRLAVLTDLPIPYAASVAAKAGMPKEVYRKVKAIEASREKPACAEDFGVDEDQWRKWHELIFHFEGLDLRTMDESPTIEEQAIDLEREHGLMYILETMTEEERAVVLDGKSHPQSEEIFDRIAQRVCEVCK